MSKLEWNSFMSNLPAVNIHGILDNELARIHNLLQHYASLNAGRSGNYGQYGGNSESHEIYARIQQMQEILLKAVATHDSNIQEKVAELALTGTKE